MRTRKATDAMKHHVIRMGGRGCGKTATYYENMKCAQWEVMRDYFIAHSELMKVSRKPMLTGRPHNYGEPNINQQYGKSITQRFNADDVVITVGGREVVGWIDEGN